MDIPDTQYQYCAALGVLHIGPGTGTWYWYCNCELTVVCRGHRLHVAYVMENIPE